MSQAGWWAWAMALLGLAWPVGAAGAVEGWAEGGLPVRDGLVAWYDVGRQAAARTALGLPSLVPAGPVDALLDGSGGRRHLTQPVAGQRPVYLSQGAGRAALAFDGRDDFLGAAGWERRFTNLTVFVVAAPRTNAGFFRGFLSFNRSGQNDYTSGLNLDLGAAASPDFSRVNAEGAGFGGERNLLDGPLPSGAWATLALVSRPGPGGVELFAQGQLRGRRDREPASVPGADEFRLGARLFANDGSLPAVAGFFDGRLAEVLVYERALPGPERAAVEQYLAARHAGSPGGPPTVPLVTVTNPPPIQMLVPGFEVTELPVTLRNVNNLRYRPDGALYAVCYDGTVWLLRDTNGDGLEDRVVPFWTNGTLRSPVGAAVTPPGYARGEGLFVPAIRRLALVVDTNRDDRADLELTCTSWEEGSDQGNVDALGCALDREGNIYFGVGTASFTDGHQVKATGTSRYRRDSIRGTVQRLAPDWSRRETVCTGVRFTVGMAFNRAGDLFVTDQEGATWLPNGNPFDELLHIQPGRHYGFPPRHPRHLPGVVDEPSVFDYGPQHQSTCGLAFNEPVNGGPTFGPPGWAGDALVVGESRGKLYRTQLVRTPEGYVAQNQLLACLRELAVDVTVTPRGDLLVATHSGAPDWGTGPTGRGHLYRIRHASPSTPRPSLAWSAGPAEIRVSWDRPPEPESVRNLPRRARLEVGRHVMPGDRFETIRPGYQVVRDQLAQPRFEVAVLGSRLDADGRTLSLFTAPRPDGLPGALALPGGAELAIDHHGVQAEWKPADGRESTSLWLPHADGEVARALTAGSAAHAAFFAQVKEGGTLTLRGQLDLWEMLQPAIQPGARLDHEREAEEVTVVFSAAAPFTLAATAGEAAGDAPRHSQRVGSRHQLSWQRPARRDAWVPFRLDLAVTREAPDVRLHWFTGLDARPRAFPRRRFQLPWARPEREEMAPTAVPLSRPELAGGHWLQGRRLFHGAQLACARCHPLRGEGGRVGPDLSNLIHRDYASVVRDIAHPNAALNPDHLASIVELADGSAQTGVIVEETPAAFTLVDAAAQPRRLPRAQVTSMRPSTVSLMPEGLWEALTGEQRRDLMTFLLTEPLEPAPMERDGAPPPRSVQEVEAILAAAPDAAATNRASATPLRIVLCDGPKDHGRGEHDYPLWKKRWSTLLALADGVRVETAHIWPSREQWARADVTVFFNNNPGWNAERAAELDAYLARGGGAVYFHWAVEARERAAEFAQRIGLASDGARLRFRHGPVQLVLGAHPLLRGFTAASFRPDTFIDETYWQWVGNPAAVTVLASAVEDGVSQPQVWLREAGPGRVFVAIPGHYNWTFDDPVFRVLALRGICWAAGQPMDRLAELALVGSRRKM